MTKFTKTKFGKISALFILPIILFLAAFFFKLAGGPYYLNYYDPGYVYLVNSINVMQFENVGHIDHPGTSLQIFGAVILKILLLGKSEAQILDTVFSDPESYLNILNKSLVLINCIALLALGIFAYRKTKNLIFSLLIQLSVFISFEIYYGLVIFSPENFLILSTILISGILVYYVYDDDSDKHMFALAITLGIVCGFGSVSKLNFVPVCLLPLLLLKGFRNKLIFVLASVITFVIFFLPAISNVGRFLKWSGNLTVNNGIHGKIDLSGFNLSLYLDNIVVIFSKDMFFTIVFLLIIIVLVYDLLVWRKVTSPQSSSAQQKLRKVLWAILFTMVFQVIVVAKNYMPYAQYYVIPALMLTMTGFAFLIPFIFGSMSINRKSISNIAYFSAFMLVLLFSVYEFASSYQEASTFRDEALKINKLVKEINSTSVPVIPSVGTANEDCALALCVMYGYSGKRTPLFRNEFSKRTDSRIFHNYWENKFFTISDSVDIAKEIRQNKKIVVQLMSVTTIDMIVGLLKNEYGVDVVGQKLLMQNGNMESLYEIQIK